MIISKLSGGLGNQLFQYAMGKAVSQRLGAVLKLDASGLDSPVYRSPRRYELAPFRLPEALATADEVAELTRPERTGLAKLMPWRAPQPPASHVQEQHFHFDPQLVDLPDNIYLNGYWQTEQYFTAIAPAIREALTVADPPTDESAALAAQIAGCHSVSLHVRRGDYLTDPAVLAMHGVCSAEYYTSAVAYVAERMPDLELFIFSDEPDWARANLSFAHPTHVVDVNGADHCHEDLRLMSGCRHHIIANSTFSWWGAWLNPDPAKMVVAPKRWFDDFDADTGDLYPVGWTPL